MVHVSPVREDRCVVEVSLVMGSIVLYVYVNVKHASRARDGRHPFRRTAMFELSQDHEDFRMVVRDFAEKEVAPHIAKWDAAAYFPADLVPKMGDLGLFGLVVPEEYGGAGESGDFTSLCVAIEELGRVDQSVGITLSAGVGLGINPILTYGTDITDVLTVTARTGTNADGSPEISAIMVPSGTPGFIVEPAYHKLGWHVSDTHGLTFESARVPVDNLLGEPGQGFRQFLKTLDDGRIAISALAVGCAQACLELATDYAKGREAFGRPIGANQGVAFPIADMAVMVEGARLLTYKAA